MTDWEVLGLTEDPTPGDPEILKKLAEEYQKVSDQAESAFDVIRRIKDSNLGSGKAMDKLKEIIDGDLPKQVGALRDSYDKAAKAIRDYAPLLIDHQRDADRALADGKVAKTKLDAAIATAATAGAALTTLDNGPKPPDSDETAKANAKRDLENARSAVTSANGAVSSAQTELDAAKLLAVQARDTRERSGSAAATAMGDAEDGAVKEKNFWDKLWDKLGSIFGIISAILGVLSFLVPGLQGLGLLLGSLSLLTGLVPLAINIARGVVTGDWDVLGIVLGVVGTAFGGFSILKGLGATFGPLLKGGRGAVPRPTGSPSHTPPGSPSHTPPGSPPPRPPSPPPGGAADDIELQPLPPQGPPPRPPSSASNSSDGSFTTAPSSPRPSTVYETPPTSPRPGTPEPTTTPPGSPPPSPAPSVPSPAPSVPSRPPSATPPPSPVPPPVPQLPNLGAEISTVINNITHVNPASLGQWLSNMAGAARGNVPGTIGFTTALIGFFYAPIATAGHAPGAVAHGNPLVGNTNPEPNPA